MATQLHNTGEESILDDFFEQSLTKPGRVYVGLFYDAVDGLSDNNTTGGITTEPSGSYYARQAAAFGTTDFTNSYDGTTGDWESIIADQTFDTSNSSQNVDAYFTTIYFTSDDKGTQTDHLLFTGDLDQMYDLNSVDSFTLSGGGLSLD